MNHLGALQSEIVSFFTLIVSRRVMSNPFELAVHWPRLWLYRFFRACWYCPDRTTYLWADFVIWRVSIRWDLGLCLLQNVWRWARPEHWIYFKRANKFYPGLKERNRKGYLVGRGSIHYSIMPATRSDRQVCHLYPSHPPWRRYSVISRAFVNERVELPTLPEFWYRLTTSDIRSSAQTWEYISNQLILFNSVAKGY